ncbi:MAG: hypothetical protein WBB08_10450 [Halobacteriota archaeon]
MSNDVAKSGQLCGFKLKMAGRGIDLFKRRFYMNVGIMWRAHSGQPGVASGTSERCGIASGGGF